MDSLIKLVNGTGVELYILTAADCCSVDPGRLLLGVAAQFQVVSEDAPLDIVFQSICQQDF